MRTINLGKLFLWERMIAYRRDQEAINKAILKKLKFTLAEKQEIASDWKRDIELNEEQRNELNYFWENNIQPRKNHKDIV